MLMRQKTVYIALLACLVVDGGWCLPGTAIAQHKAPAKAEADVEAPAREKSRSLWLRRIDWRSTGCKVKAPEYTYRNALQTAAKIVPEWQMLTVTYDTAPDWMDRIVVKYHVLLLNERKGYGGEPAKTAPRVEAKEPDAKMPPYVLLEGTVSYVDVKKGPGHISTMFIRPNTIERHGAVVAVGIEITAGDEIVGKSEYSTLSKISPEAKKSGEWWSVISKSDQVAVRNDCLFNRSQTPFVLVNYLDEEAIQ
jgi:hypothetical protein